MTRFPYIAIGNDELGPELEPTIRCRSCGQEHPIECSSNNPANAGCKVSLQFYRCAGKTFLAGIDHRSLLF